MHNKYDDIKGKAYDAKLMKRLLGYVKPYKKYVVLAILLNILVAGLGPLRALLTKIAVDDYITTGDYKGLKLIASFLILALVFQTIFLYALNYFTQYMGQKIIYDLRIKVFSHAHKLSLKFFDRTPVGKIVTNTTSDIESLDQMFSSGIVMIFSDIFTIVWILIFMFSMSWELSLVTLSILPILFYGTFLFRKKVRKVYREVRQYLSRLNSFMEEKIMGINIIKIFNKEKEEEENFRKINYAHKKANIDSIFYYALFYPSVELVSAIAFALIIWYGGTGVINNTLTIGILLAFIQLAEQFFRPIRDLSEKYNILQTAMASSERIFNLLDNKTIIENTKTPIKLEKIKGEIEYRNVYLAYNGEDYVLKDISFKINPGETVAIVGATGSGKTSIISTLMRLYEINSGEILLDGKNIKEILKEDLRQYLSIVLQDVLLFSGTIKSNINLNSSKISEEEIISASKTVGADLFIKNLPNGYDEKLKEKGSSLSMGQRQLISFARALAFNPKVLILDEATSNIDTETEILIQRAIEKLLKNRTSIVIAHRLSTIQNADRIIVMHKGRIREMGTHQELLSRKDIYYKLYQFQYKDQKICN